MNQSQCALIVVGLVMSYTSEEEVPLSAQGKTFVYPRIPITFRVMRLIILETCATFKALVIATEFLRVYFPPSKVRMFLFFSLSSSRLSSQYAFSIFILQFAMWVDAVIFVFSLEDEISFQTVYHYYSRMANYRNTSEIPMVLVGTQGKCSPDVRVSFCDCSVLSWQSCGLSFPLSCVSTATHLVMRSCG